jgi:ABC-type multidrug transport system ATPase subunit/ABC-type multidrug transport system permease subunit
VNSSERDLNGGATVMLRNGVTHYFKRMRGVEPENVSKFRNIDITLHDVTYTARIPARAKIETVGFNKLTESFAMGVRATAAKGPAVPQMVDLKVLDSVALSFPSGSVSLILGPPGSGRSSLLKAIAGLLPASKVVGDVCFNGLPVVKVDRLRTVALIDQTDYHIPVLTVRETLDFACACQRGQASHEDSVAYAALQNQSVDVMLRLLGLLGCADTYVGNADIRGISGGQRRRVTAGEVLVSGVSVVLGDELSTGLDSQASFDIVKSLRSWAKAMNGTVILALLQPSPEVVALFDQLILLDQGKVVVHGTAAQVEDHFRSLGFVCPPRKDFADFLQEVTSAAGRSYFDPLVVTEPSMLAAAKKRLEQRLARDPDAASTVALAAAATPAVTATAAAAAVPQAAAAASAAPSAPPGDLSAALAAPSGPSGALDAASAVTAAHGAPPPALAQEAQALVAPPADVDEFVRLYRATDVFASLQAELSQKLDETGNSTELSAEAMRLVKRADAPHFSNSFFRSLVLLMEREWTLSLRDVPMLKTLFSEALIIALLMGTIFYNLAAVQYYTTPRSGVGALFFCCAILQRQSWQQIPSMMTKRPSFYKQRRRDFFPTLAFVLAIQAVQVPFNIMAMCVFCPIVYFMVGYTASANNFFFFFFTMLCLQHALRAIFTSIGAVAPSASSAQYSCATLVINFLLFSGYLIANFLIPPYFIWVYYPNPLALALRSMVINEYTNLDKYTREQSDYVLGQYGMRDMSSLWWMWLGPVVLLAYFFSFTLLAALLLHLVRHDGIRGKAVLPNDEDDSTRANLAPNGVSALALEAAQPGAAAAASAFEPSWRATPAAAASATPATSLATSLANGAAGAALAPAVRASDLALLELGHGGGSNRLLLGQGTAEFEVRGRQFHPVTLAFKEVSYRVFPKGRPGGLQLLNNVSGVFRPGVLTALMGSSGAGKTTLLDVVAGRKTQGEVDGLITINGHEAHASDFSKISGYCEQMDVHSPQATVYEAFLFSAILRQPMEVPLEDKVRFSENVVALLKMRALRDRLIGSSPVDGLTVEQRKRVTIGVELCANPAVLFADEPTSGLDARAALLVMKVLQRIARARRTVVATIHQPSAVLFEMFDWLLLLQHGGVTVYNGPLGPNSSTLIAFLQAGGAREIFEGENPANYMLEAIGGGIRIGGGHGRTAGEAALANKRSPSPRSDFVDEPESTDSGSELRTVKSSASGASSSTAASRLKGVVSARFFSKPSSSRRADLDSHPGLPGGDAVPDYPATAAPDSPPRGGDRGDSTGGELSSPAPRVGVADVEQVDFSLVWDASELKQLADDAVDAAVHMTCSDAEIAALIKYPGDRSRAASFGRQVAATTRKAFITYYRSPMYNLKRAITLLVLGFIFGFAFFRGGKLWPLTTTPQVRAICAMIYSAMDFIGILSMITVMPITVRERSVYYRERAARMYSGNAYAVALFTVELPYLMICTLLFTGVLYLLVGLAGLRYGQFLLGFFLYVSLCTFLGQLFAFITPHEVIGAVVIGFTTVSFNLTSGYLVRQGVVTDVVSWLFYLSPSFYAFNYLASALLIPPEGVSCATADISIWIGCSVLSDQKNKMTVADWAIVQFQLDPERTWLDIVVLLAFWLVVIGSTVLTLHFVSWNTK